MKLFLFILLLLICGISRGQTITIDSIINRKGNSFLLHGKDENNNQYVFVRRVRGMGKIDKNYYLNKAFTYWKDGIKQRHRKTFFTIKQITMKTKISVEIHKNGTENDVLLRMIANINQGRVKDIPTKADIISYLTVRNSIWPISHEFSHQVDEEYLHISEDGGKTFTLSLEWKEVAEISELDEEIENELSNADDLKNVNI